MLLRMNETFGNHNPSTDTQVVLIVKLSNTAYYSFYQIQVISKYSKRGTVS